VENKFPSLSVPKSDRSALRNKSMYQRLISTESDVCITSLVDQCRGLRRLAGRSFGGSSALDVYFGNYHFAHLSEMNNHIQRRD